MTRLVRIKHSTNSVKALIVYDKNSGATNPTIPPQSLKQSLHSGKNINLFMYDRVMETMQVTLLITLQKSSSS